MIFSDIDINDVRELMTKSKELPAVPLLYLINYAGLTDDYMHRFDMTFTEDNIGFLAIYHKLYHSLPKYKLNLANPNKDTAKALLLCRICGENEILSESSLEEDCKNFARKNRRHIEDVMYPILIDCETDPLANIDFNKVMRSSGKDIEIDEQKLNSLLTEGCDTLAF